MDTHASDDRDNRRGSYISMIVKTYDSEGKCVSTFEGLSPPVNSSAYWYDSEGKRIACDSGSPKLSDDDSDTPPDEPQIVDG